MQLKTTSWPVFLRNYREENQGNHWRTTVYIAKAGRRTKRLWNFAYWWNPTTCFRRKDYTWHETIVYLHLLCWHDADRHQGSSKRRQVSTSHYSSEPTLCLRTKSWAAMQHKRVRTYVDIGDCSTSTFYSLQCSTAEMDSQLTKGWSYEGRRNKHHDVWSNINSAYLRIYS